MNRLYNEETTERDTARGRAARAAPAARLLPAAALLVALWLLAWQGRGSIAPVDWLATAVFAALLLATVLAAGPPARPGRLPLAGLGALVGLAAWAAVSASWSPSPSGARDEALLAALYAVSLAVPLLTLPFPADRLRALVLLVAALGSLAAATAVKLAVEGSTDLFYGGRLNFPLSYVNAASALFALGFWPAIVLSIRRDSPVLGRAAALAAAVGLLAAAGLAQSKGTAIGLAASTLAMFGFVPRRLRLLPPTLVSAAVVAVAFRPLTAAYRAHSTAALERAIRHGGWLVLACAAAGFVAGAALALADRRLALGEQARRRLGAAVLLLLVAVCAGGIALFFAREHHPGRFVEAKWRSFKHLDVKEQSSTHLVALGSNRYDFWRVALGQFEHHPVAGIGARGFYTAYLQHRRSPETPLRAHSVYLDALSEEGIVGFLLLAGAVGLPLAALARRLDRAPAAAAFGGGIYFLAHAGVDWLWTFPALGIPFFLLLGIGAARDGGRLRRSLSLAAAAASFLLALLAFAPPWISARLTANAYGDPARAATDLRWARRLDPLSLDPLWARWRLAPSAAARIPPLEEARRMQPKSVAVLTQLGLSYEAAGRRADARRALAEALRLDPRDRALAAALRRASR